MEKHIPKPGERYMDAEQRPYQILCMADHADTKEKMIVYQALYGEFQCFVKPFEMQTETIIKDAHKKENPSQETAGKEITSDKTAGENDTGSEDMQADPALLMFLDADTLQQKYQILKSLELSITDRLIDDFAVALDLVIPEGDLDFRYQQLLSSVRTMQSFETNRFRR